MIQDEAAINEAPQLIIPFSFAKEVFDKAALEWLSVGDYTPADVLDSFHNSGTKGIYVPVYIWDIAYVHTSPMGSKTGSITTVTLSEGQKAWPSELVAFAKASVKVKSRVKTFDKVYTLGFEVQEEDMIDVDDFNKRARQSALDAIVTENRLKDGTAIVINKMVLTKVYAPFWINKYKYQGQNYELIMSGFDVSRMGGTRPLDTLAMNTRKPDLKRGFQVMLAGIFMIVTGVFFAGAGFSAIGNTITVIGTILLLLVGPVMMVIALIRAISFKDPSIKLKKERDAKLAQRLAQHG